MKLLKSTVFRELESGLQLGQIKHVKGFIKEIQLSQISRKHAAKIANLARRVGEPALSIQILHPYVRPKVAIIEKATDEEVAEYAIALSHVGAINEAYQLLKTVSEQKFELVNLYKAFSLFHRWDYEKAIPYLKKYLATNKANEYFSCVAKVNLAAAYTNLLRDEEAASLVSEVQKVLSMRGYKLLLSNILEISIELSLRKSDIKTAKRDIETSLQILGDSHERYVLYANKWRAVLKLFDASKVKHNKDIEKIKEEALQKKYWEVSRECDFYNALANGNKELFFYGFFGTPYWPYRQKISKWFSENHTLPSGLDVVVGPSGFRLKGKKEAIQIFDVERGVDLKSGARLKEGHLHHRLLQVLSSDFYRPLSTEALFGFLFPKQYFNPNTSSGRVYNAISFLRNWLKQNNVPLQIFEDEGYYSLVSPSPIVLRVGPFPKSKLPIDYFVRSIGSNVLNQTFNVNKAMAITGFSLSKVKRLLSIAVDDGQIVRIGKGPNTVYLIKEVK